MIILSVEKLPPERLELLISILDGTRFSILPQFCSDMIFSNTLLNDVREVDKCKLAYQKPADTVQGIVADLPAELVILKRPSLLLPSISVDPMAAPAAYYVDRRFVRSKSVKNGN